jgi:hypothetical protein
MQAVYTVNRIPAGWVIQHDGDTSPSYDTVESAFEAAVTAASLALREGLGVTISVDPETVVDVEQPGADEARPLSGPMF